MLFSLSLWTEVPECQASAEDQRHILGVICKAVPLLNTSQAARSVPSTVLPSAFHHLKAAVMDAVSREANVATLPWAPEGRRWRREETKPSLQSCWRDAQRVRLSRRRPATASDLRPFSAQEVSVRCWCAQFCWGQCLLFSWLCF